MARSKKQWRKRRKSASSKSSELAVLPIVPLTTEEEGDRILYNDSSAFLDDDHFYEFYLTDNWDISFSIIIRSSLQDATPKIRIVLVDGVSKTPH